MSSRCSRATRGPTVPSPKLGGGNLRTKAQGGEGAATHPPPPFPPGSGSFEGKIGGRWGTPHKCCCQPPLALVAAGEAQHALSMEGHFPGGPPLLCQPGTRDGMQDNAPATTHPRGAKPRPVGLEVPLTLQSPEGTHSGLPLCVKHKPTPGFSTLQGGAEHWGPRTRSRVPRWLRISCQLCPTCGAGGAQEHLGVLPGCSLGCCLPWGETQPQVRASLLDSRRVKLILLKQSPSSTHSVPHSYGLAGGGVGWGRSWRTLWPQKGAWGEQPAEPGGLRQEPPLILTASSAAVPSPARPRLQRRSSPRRREPIAAETSLYPLRILAADSLPATT